MASYSFSFYDPIIIKTGLIVLFWQDSKTQYIFDKNWTNTNPFQNKGHIVWFSGCILKDAFFVAKYSHFKTKSLSCYQTKETHWIGVFLGTELHAIKSSTSWVVPACKNE